MGSAVNRLFFPGALVTRYFEPVQHRKRRNITKPMDLQVYCRFQQTGRGTYDAGRYDEEQGAAIFDVSADTANGDDNDSIAALNVGWSEIN